MQRYLLNISYIGTQFRGVQKSINHIEPCKPDWTTIQGVLELGLINLKSINYPYVVPSSRTDSGVHALHSTFHVDLNRQNNLKYETTTITTVLNKFFTKYNLQLQVLNTNLVPNEFHCRFNAKSRTYLYRIAILKPEFVTKNDYINPIPIEEINRCHFINYKDFNFEKMYNVTPLFRGLHDFRTFMGRGSHLLHKKTRRVLQQLEFVAGCTSATVQSNFHENVHEKYDYWTILVNADGFLYNQVRRIVGTLIAAGQGKLEPCDIKLMLQVPSHLSWDPRIQLAPSYALYLSKVDYSRHDLNSFQ